MGYGVYQATFELGAGGYVYSFASNGTSESISGDCTDADGNRQMSVVDGPLTLDAACYGECDLCSGCTDPFATGYSPFAGMDDGSCGGPVVEGCTYPDADNYNPAASVDDGSCEISGVSSVRPT